MQKIIHRHAQGEIMSREQYLFPLKNVSVCVGTLRHASFMCLSIAGVTATPFQSNPKSSKIYEGFCGRKLRKMRLYPC